MKLFRNIFRKDNQRFMWLRVPLECKDREDSERIIYETIRILEQKLILNK
mgnify:CR=1 FL=1